MDYTEWTLFPQQGIITTQVKYYTPEKLIRDSVSKVFIGAPPIGTYYMAHTEFPNSQKESIQYSAKTILFAQTV